MASEQPQSVAEPSSQGPGPRVKLRKQTRSCDLCRQRKSRCDGPDMPNGCCSNCLAFGSECTYAEPSQKRGPKNTKNITIEKLKKENASLKAQLRSISVCSLCTQPLQPRPLEDRPSGTQDVSVFPYDSPQRDNTPSELSDEQDLTGEEMAARFNLLSMDSLKTKYFGSASGYALADNAITIKEKYIGRPSTHWRRPVFWDVLPWEKESYDSDRPSYVYPSADLITCLLDLYFTNVHPTLPILHRPSFERSVAEGLHLVDMEFGGLFLAVLAIASWYSDDPRVFVDSDTSLSSGWKFAKQVRIRRYWFEPTIHEVQMYGLMTLFVIGTSVPQVAWLYLGVGIRCLFQRGVHRRRPEGQPSGAEKELWKRAFWSFIALERMVCLFTGRPMSLHAEDYDVEMPLEVDDEYWSRGFVQPLGKLSQLSYFVCRSRLCEIIEDVFRRVYGSTKAKLRLSRDGPEWEQRAVADLDSSMNDYSDSIPPHLRWDPENPPDGAFFDQSAELHITYNYVLIVIHRQYIHKVAVSLSICASAARTIIHTADIWLRKRQRVPLPTLTNAVFVSGLILVLYTLKTKRAGLSHDKNKDLVQVATAMDFLKFGESRFQPVGRLWEILGEIWSFDGPFPKHPMNETDSAAREETSAITDAPGPPLTELYPQFEQSLEFWNTTLSSLLLADQPVVPASEMSFDELLSAGDTVDAMDTALDDELFSMWMTMPKNIQQWDTYIQQRQTDGAWSDNFGG
ncbi:fungal-specific transcription factor domain-containing protein [Mycena albidolilacea]|uniref:Fungal-specific transcription factor domain-containing protein n=1 Tax=Mycena albidolilacea TaxID=1033008 RepID=A0AAD7EA25_9AGAR|nr:fungal-specific transcription factor domain-containing protein [Mycena albidolilacea]